MTEESKLEVNFPFTFYWKIDRFKMGMLFRKEWLYSPTFSLPFTNIAFKILLHPHFVSTKYVSIYIRRLKNHEIREFINEYEIFLSIVNRDYANVRSIIYRGNVENFDYWGSEQFLDWYSILKEKDMLLPKGTLTIKCEIKLNIENPRSLSSCLNNFHKLYDKENRYPPQIKLLNSTTQTTTKSENCTTGFIPNKHYKIPVLHNWFEYLYSKKLTCTSFRTLKTIIGKELASNSKTLFNSSSQKWVFTSRLKSEDVFFTWHIKEFSKLDQDDKFFSHAFRCGSNYWKLLFYLTVDNEGKETAEIVICPMSLYLTSKKIIKCRISVINSEGRLPLSQESVHLYNNDGQWRFPSFIHVENLNNSKKSYLANDILQLYCTFSVSDGKYEGEQSWKALEHNRVFQSQYLSFWVQLKMAEDFLLLLETGRFSDVIVKVGPVKLLAHKSILSERSKEFRSYFKCASKNRDGGKTIIEIRDLEEETLRKLFKFIYCGQHHYNDYSVMLAACTYGVDEEIMENELAISATVPVKRKLKYTITSQTAQKLCERLSWIYPDNFGYKAHTSVLRILFEDDDDERELLWNQSEIFRILSHNSIIV